MRASALLAITVAGFAVAGDKPPVADQKVVSWVQSQVRKLEPSRTERRFDEIGWVSGLLNAEELARKHQRPIFLFTHDGDISTGRC